MQTSCEKGVGRTSFRLGAAPAATLLRSPRRQSPWVPKYATPAPEFNFEQPLGATENDKSQSRDYDRTIVAQIVEFPWEPGDCRIVHEHIVFPDIAVVGYSTQ